jgi:AcrR family transcriptional regulator
MAGPRKAYPKKRAEILEAAWLLFSERGYDATPVSAVIDHLGISKGTFYHYFSSKADLLEGVVEWIADVGFEEIKPILIDDSLDPLEKLNAFLAASRDWRLAKLCELMVVMEVLLRDENIIIRRKMNRYSSALVVPHLAKIISQGAETGAFKAAYPTETAEIIIHLGQVIGELNGRDLLACINDPTKVKAVIRRTRIYLESLRRILAAPPGAFKDLEAGFVDRITEAFGSGIENPRSR